MFCYGMCTDYASYFKADLLSSICKRNSNHEYTKVIHRPSFITTPANNIIIPESPLVRPHFTLKDYPPYKATTNFRWKSAFADPGVPGAGLFARNKPSQDPLEVDDDIHAERMDAGHLFAQSIRKTPNLVLDKPETPNPPSCAESYFPSMVPFTSNRAKPKDSSVSVRSKSASKLPDLNEDGGKEHELVKSRSSRDGLIAVKALDTSENAYRAHNLELKKALKSHAKEINKLRGLLTNRKSMYLKHREKDGRALCDLQLQLDEIREELEISRSHKEEIIQPPETASLKSLSEFESVRKAYRRQEEVLRHRASQLKDAKPEIEALKMQIQTRERSDHEAEIAKLRAEVEDLKKRLPSSTIPQQRQRYCYRDLFAAAPELRPDRLLFDAEAKKVEIADRPSRKAQFGSVLANVWKERGIFPHREKNRHVEEVSRTDRGVAIVIEKRKPGSKTSEASESSSNFDDKAEGASRSEADLVGTGAPRSNHEALREYDGLMRIPKVVIPCLVDKQLAYRDGTRVSMAGLTFPSSLLLTKCCTGCQGTTSTRKSYVQGRTGRSWTVEMKL